MSDKTKLEKLEERMAAAKAALDLLRQVGRKVWSDTADKIRASTDHRETMDILTAHTAKELEIEYTIRKARSLYVDLVRRYTEARTAHFRRYNEWPKKGQ